ncbi:MAG: major capsid protein [Candidatus Methanomethylicaceae archaeon]
MKRSKYSLSHYRLSTFNMGQLVPVGCFEVLPGDTIQHATSCLIRVTPLLTPVMHPVRVRIHHWFVPYRLVWDQWEEFITGGPQGSSTPTMPTHNFSTASTGFKSLYDYMGASPRSDGSAPALAFNALPVRAYNLIYNEFYRDQDLTPEVNVNNSVLVQNVAWEKDYFTTCRPWPQKGPQVTVPLSSQMAPVVPDAPNAAPFFKRTMGAAPEGTLGTVDASTKPAINWLGGISGNVDDNLRWGDPHLAADLSAASPDINAFRRAFAIQRYQEARAQYGSRYTEYLRYLGVRSSDARLQRPEYLGGGKQTIAFSEVLQTGPDANGDGVADLRGHGIAAMRSRRYRRFFEEHGVVLSLASVLPRTIYANEVPRMWLRRTKEDFWQRELQHIGQQEVSNTEVYSDAGTAGMSSVFGYQDRYAEYRHIQSGVSGEFRTLLNDWHFARIFAAQPVLNNSFVQANPANRPFAEKTQDSLWCMFQHSIQARRMVTKSTIGRLI